MIKSFKQITPKIYGYIHPDYEPHKGYIKIGYTEDISVEKRVKSDHITNNVKYQIVFQDNAINNKKQVFSDKDFHMFLEKKGYRRLEDQTNSRKSGKPEFFYITLDELKNEMKDFKQGTFEYNHSSIPYTLRDEQIDAINLTINYYNKCLENEELSKEFLWNAKPRFGKTLTAYDFAHSINAKKILILTNRPAIQDSWYSDYLKFIKGKYDYEFLSAKPITVEYSGKNYKSLTRDEQLKYNLVDKSYIFFISLQNIKGTISETEFKQNNKWIFDDNLLSWDLVIIDESHEGVATSKADFVLRNLKRNFTLNLSGTPFKAIASQKFSTDQIYNWTYADEQDAKLNWKDENGNNPYSKLPKMNIYTYELSTALEVKLEEALSENKGYAFDLTEFLSVSNGKFIYEKEVNRFLDNLSGLNEKFDPNNKPYPFATTEIRNELRHTFWLLPNRVEVVKAMKELLKNHPLFKEYEIILAAGTGDDEGEGKSSLEKVKNAIKNYDKTITLSCGQLTTGITIPELTGILMLSNTGSPSQYLQTAFRAQNPYEYTDSDTFETKYKTDCYLFDFAPDRVLKVVADYATSLINDGTLTREPKIKKLLNFLTVLAEDNEGKLKELDARDILELPLKIITKEVISRGFMSNKLFDNIANVFGASIEIREIINKLQPEKNKKLSKPINMDDHKIELDEKGNISYNDNEIQKIITSSNGLLGEKEYVIEGTDEANRVQEELELYSSGKIALSEEKKKKLDEIDIITKEEELELAKEELIKKKEKDKNSEENQIRDRLRGFSRTIPTFLMAYGRTEKRITLHNFDVDIPEDDFVTVTSITKEEFHKLKDAHLFNEDVFNASINEFIETKRRLANYFKNENEDIFDYIPPQKTNQIFTPKIIVKKMVDLIEKNNKDIFKNMEYTFVDLYMKSGLYIAEIIKRLYKGLESQIPNEKERIIHILSKQIYGLAPTDILYNICVEYIFGFLKENNIFDKTEIYKLTDNIKKIDLLDIFLNNSSLDWRKEVFGTNMKFDVIIGNPPYQGINHQQIYPYFYNNSIKSAEKVCLIFPIGWQQPKNGNNLKMMNTREIKEDSQIVQIDNIQNAFPGISGAEWVNIIYWEKNYNNGLNGKQLILTNSKDSNIVKLIWDVSDIEKPNEIIQLAKIVTSRNDFKSIASITSSRKPYGISTNFFKEYKDHGIDEILNEPREGSIKVYGSLNKIQYLKKDTKLPKISSAFNKYKVFVAYAWGNMCETSGLGGAFSDIIVASPKEIATETYLESGNFSDIGTAKKHAKYLMTKFVRALLYANKSSQHSTTAWGAIPIQDYSEEWWSQNINVINEKLMDKYSIDKNIRDFVNNNIQEKSEKNILNY